jgi:hypothetical protein
LTGKLPCVTELATRTSVGIEGRRPGWFRVLVYTWVGVGIGMVLGLLALSAPALLGVAIAIPQSGSSQLKAPFAPAGGVGAVAANLAAFTVALWGVVFAVRRFVGWSTDVRPAVTWTAAPLAVGMGTAALSWHVATGGGIVFAGLTLRYFAYDHVGRPRPEPLEALFGAWSRRRRWALGALVPAVLVAVATGYAMYHPLQGGWWSGGEGTDFSDPVRVTRAPLVVRGPSLHNQGGRAVKVLAIEPGRERGYALHLVGIVMDKPGVTLPGQPYTKPFAPFTLGAHGDRDDLSLRISRAGCRPGASGRIDSVRVRYLLGGEHAMELPLETPLTLSC